MRNYFAMPKIQKQLKLVGVKGNRFTDTDHSEYDGVTVVKLSNSYVHRHRRAAVVMLRRNITRHRKGCTYRCSPRMTSTYCLSINIGFPKEVRCPRLQREQQAARV